MTDIPTSFSLRDSVDWASPLEAVFLYVELPFWLMVEPGAAPVEWNGISFDIEVMPQWGEVFLAEVTDSRETLVHHGPFGKWVPDSEFNQMIDETGQVMLERPTKTILRLRSRAHACLFLDAEQAGAVAPNMRNSYWATLCEAYIPVINELIQRYRLATYDPFPYEVSPWDVPVWNAKHGDEGWVVNLSQYRSMNERPYLIHGLFDDGPTTAERVAHCDLADLTADAHNAASPGEYDLLDARSLMERGDFSGAIRRTVTAVETLIDAKVEPVILRSGDGVAIRKHRNKLRYDWGVKLQMIRDETGNRISDVLEREFAHSQEVRNDSCIGLLESPWPSEDRHKR